MSTNINRVEVLILNHKNEAVEKFGRNAQAINYYQEGSSKDLINDLYQHWFGINEACIIAHHLATMNDEGDGVNYLVAVNHFNSSQVYELNKAKGKRLRYAFIFFDTSEYDARAYAYQTLRPLLLENKTQPVAVDIDYHNVSFF